MDEFELNRNEKESGDPLRGDVLDEERYIWDVGARVRFDSAI